MPTSESTRAALVCVGSELLRGKLNTHASTLARRLASIGIELYEENTLGDERPELTRAIRRALNQYSLVIVTGGLGPTFDDVTREAAAAAVGRPLVPSARLLAGIRRKFRRARYRHMPPANTRQAELIQGAVALENRAGTAPGQWLALGGQVLVLLPGPPSELHPMLEKEVLPRLKKAFPARPTAEAHLHFVGVPESIVDHRLRPIIASTEKSGVQVRFTILAHLGLVDFDIFVSAGTEGRARSAKNRLVGQIRRRMGKFFYGMDEDYPLEKVVGDRLRRKGLTLALAESCTGGRLAGRLTDISGSSDYFLGGVVSYDNRVKQGVLGVPEELLKEQGAVSAPVAKAMAEGARRRLGASIGLSITGIAGPTGGTAKKPVGLVFLGVAMLRSTKIFQFRFPGSRESVRQRAVIAALDLLRQI